MNKLGNTSSAVMQQRRLSKAALDDFPTPPWSTRSFCTHILEPWAENFGASLDDLSCWEPACNRGFMARPLGEFFGSVYATDVIDYGWSGQKDVHDFLQPYTPALAGAGAFDWIITNPPFRLAMDFAERCEGLSPSCGYALLTRIAFLEGVERYERLFRHNPPKIIAQYAERVPMVEGRYDPAASTASAYCWLVWLNAGGRAWSPPQMEWIPAGRKRFERPEDANG